MLHYINNFNNRCKNRSQRNIVHRGIASFILT